MTMMKTFNDLKVGDYVYRYYITYISSENKNEPLFFRGLRYNAKHYKIIKIENNKYFYESNGTICSQEMSDKVVDNSDDKFNTYCFYPFSTYDIGCIYYDISNAIKTISPEDIKTLKSEFAKVIQEHMDKYCEYIKQRLYNELHYVDKSKVKTISCEIPSNLTSIKVNLVKPTSRADDILTRKFDNNTENDLMI